MRTMKMCSPRTAVAPPPRRCMVYARISKRRRRPAAPTIALLAPRSPRPTSRASRPSSPPVASLHWPRTPIRGTMVSTRNTRSAWATWCRDNGAEVHREDVHKTDINKPDVPKGESKPHRGLMTSRHSGTPTTLGHSNKPKKCAVATSKDTSPENTLLPLDALDLVDGRPRAHVETIKGIVCPHVVHGDKCPQEFTKNQRCMYSHEVHQMGLGCWNTAEECQFQHAFATHRQKKQRLRRLDPWLRGTT
ncbi:hypothetical protein F4778DRAFT_756816 [Xylariomycetidae sp. FL2044]|nr:hypothetical protein F4778DRAFT_756816 [Xylariomycetidae sp. FL2044]